MKVDAKELLTSAGLKDESFYPGKKIVKKFVPPGDHKGHCMVFTWHDDIIRAELKAGIHGHTLTPKELHEYPVSFQAPTYVEIKTSNDNALLEDDEDEDGEGSRGKSGGGGKKPKMKHRDEIEGLDMSKSSQGIFSKMADGIVSTAGEIQKFVIMGKEIAKEGYAQAFENLKAQLSQTKVMAMDLMKGVVNMIQKATPGGGLEARGDESIKYKYDAEKNSPMFGGMNP